MTKPTVSDERLAEMVGAGMPCVPIMGGEVAQVVQELRQRRALDTTPAPEVASGEQMEVVGVSIWHCMDEKTQAGYGPWVRAVDHQAALDAASDGGESPYPWKGTKFVPGTSVVGPSVMLMDSVGACIGVVGVMNAESSTQVEVARALSTAGDIARTRRHLQAARKGEEENGLRAERLEDALKCLREAIEERHQDGSFDGGDLRQWIAAIDEARSKP